MWYSRIIEYATAWDVLSTKEVSWAGSFSRTFKDFSFYDPNENPTMTAMLKFIGDKEKGRSGDSIIDRYLEQARSDHNALSDISIFSYNLSKFIDNEMKKQGSSANTDMMKVLDFLGKLNEYIKSRGGKGIELGEQIPDIDKVKSSVNSTLGMGFTTLNLLLKKGTSMNEALAMFIIRGDDVNLLGYPLSQQRNLLVYQLLEARPELQYFQNQESVVNLIRRGEGTFYFPNIKEYIFSGIAENKILEIVFELLLKDFNQEDVAKMLHYLPNKTQINVAVKIDEYPQYDRFGQNIAEKLYSSIGEYDFDQDVLLIRKLKSFKKFMELIESKGDFCSPLFIIKGIAKPRVIINYLDKNPEDYEKFDPNLLDSLGSEIKNQIQQKGKAAKARIQSDGFALLEKAEQEGVIKIIKASDTAFNYAYGKDCRI